MERIPQKKRKQPTETSLVDAATSVGRKKVHSKRRYIPKQEQKLIDAIFQEDYNKVIIIYLCVCFTSNNL